ncbi:MAG: hypothetical protein IV100_04930 [Myxococcales bacterium]|nr:hypothetical protein [Myxococcales bacterium]
MKDLPSDFADALIELADHGADFVVVGGYAVAYHGYVRATSQRSALPSAHADRYSQGPPCELKRRREPRG